MAKNRIKELRLENNMTIANLADKLGVSNRAISFYEKGERDISTETLLKLSEIFNCSTDYLLYKTDVKEDLSNVYVQISREAYEKGLTPEQVKTAIDFYLKIMKQVEEKKENKDK